MTTATLNDPLDGLSVFLVGMMGAGKTTVGRALAALLDYRFFDTDDLIERVAGKSIPEIFASDGESVFRDLETQVLEQVCAYTRSVIATGGGCVMRTRNWSYLQQGLVLWLDVPADVLRLRLRGDRGRPLLQTPDPDRALGDLMEKRRSRYALADLHLSVRPEDSAKTVARRIVAQIPSTRKQS
ncbi:shikimate kinase [Rubidibacter lacunae KORDI 51-2]|uniref:Shikimate kinase n=1 Tax=Rubidibacter lacunae KORDI 51-2 TaxID=582515 RepID=U5DJQ6_9CHRO|nr:shikimate kinase [Rubidibacter lacunae]ERN39920.1 shikimate kinase [Rubidibacter lacunae KORDI 51-2]